MKDKLFKIGLVCSALIILFIAAGLIYSLVAQSLPAFKHFGFFRFIGSTDGALSFITGTFSTAALALLISLPFSMSLTLFVRGYYRRTKIAVWVSNIVNLCAVIPSIILGMGGYYLLRPILISFNIGTQGFSIFTTALVLAIMITPYASSLSNYFAKIPSHIRDGAYSLGATQSEIIWRISLPMAMKRMIAAYLLAFGRALGETMIVVMLVGNTGDTMASVIFNQFGAANELRTSTLFAIALLLFMITGIVNFIARVIIRKTIS
jgi:phosphate transport system permease protein